VRRLSFFLPSLLLLLLWQAGSVFGWWNAFLLPSPQAVGETFFTLLLNGTLFRHLQASLGRVLVGTGLAFAAGFPLGVFFGLFPRGCAPFLPILDFFRHTPPLALIPLLILWLGIGEASKIAVIILASFFPVFLNTLGGVAACDRKLIEVGRSFGLSRGAIFRTILLPSIFPHVLTGMRLALGFGFRALIGAELVAAASGLGYMIHDAEMLSRSDAVIVGILAIGILGSLLDALVLKVSSRIAPWAFQEDDVHGRP
jgi:sulfonate transport system permease protein